MATYVDWPTGSTWEDLQSLLTATEQAKQPDNEDAQEILAILKPAHMEILEQRTKLLAACRALVRQLKCYAVDEEDVQALTLAAEAMRGLS